MEKSSLEHTVCEMLGVFGATGGAVAGDCESKFLVGPGVFGGRVRGGRVTPGEGLAGRFSSWSRLSV